jgi:predicted amidohydrolase YtcJ
VASAVAVLHGKLIAAAVKPFVGPYARVIDLNGAPVIPGLNDTHDHTMQADEDAIRVRLDDVKTVAEALQRIKEAAAKKKPGEWILGGSWHPDGAAQAAALPNGRRDRQRGPEQPGLPAARPRLLAQHRSHEDRRHRPQHPQPRRRGDRQGRPGQSQRRLRGEGLGPDHPAHPAATVDEMEARYLEAMRVANAYGLTSVVDPSLNPGQIRALQRLMLAHKLTLRYAVMYNPNATVPPDKWNEQTTGIGASSGFGNEWLRLDAIGEMTSDGGMTLRTAFTRDAYFDDPQLPRRAGDDGGAPDLQRLDRQPQRLAVLDPTRWATERSTGCWTPTRPPTRRSPSPAAASHACTAA